MRNTTPNLKLTVVLVAAALPFVFPASAADSVYKCVVNGKTHYRSSPPAAGGDCKQTEILDDGPKPEELARLLDEKKRKQEQERVANEAAIKEREIRAKEIEAAAALRRARAEELQILMQQQQPAYTQSYPYPYYWGGGIIRPLPPAPTLPSPPARPPQAPSHPGGFR
jgi:hypothetical protein